MNKQEKEGGNKQLKTHWALFIIVLLAVVSYAVNSYYDFISPGGNKVQAATTATLALSPTSITVANNQTFAVNIVLNTAGNSTDSVDVLSLHFNPAVLQVIDDNTGVSGVQITPGSLFPVTAGNTVNNSTGVVQFSQIITGGSINTGGVLATINFRGIASGTSAVTIDATLGNTSDSNVAFQGNDLLLSVTNGSYTVDATSPTVSISAPANNATVNGNVTVTATAADSGGSGLQGVQFKLDGVNLGAEDTASPYSISWNSTTATNAAHILTATARDGAGNTTTSSNINVTVNNADATAPTVSITAPANGASVTGSAVTISANAADNIAVAGVQFKLDGVNLGAEDTVTPYAISWNSTTATDGTHSITAVARDAANNTTTSTAVSVTVGNAYQRTIQIDLEGRPNDAVTGTLSVLNTSKALIKSYSFTTNASGAATITFDITPQTGFLKLNPLPFLARLLSVDLSSNVVYTFPRLLTGDIVQDNIVNSVDYSELNSNWFGTDAISDLNKDGIVNSIDFSFMNQHWLTSGDQ